MTMQCKDIPDAEFLTAVGRASELRGGGWATRWDTAMVLGGYSENVAALGRLNWLSPPSAYAGLLVDPVPGFPEKVIRAKAKKLIRRGWLDGCHCGCRGDFELTKAGQVAILVATSPGHTSGTCGPEPAAGTFYKSPKPEIRLDVKYLHNQECAL